MTSVSTGDADSVAIGQAVQAVFHETGHGSALVRFRPTGETAESR
jgi:hypothetical protein